MAKRDKNHKIGSRGEWWVRGVFEEEGFACSAIDPDYGEDFFVFGESRDIIEPFKIFVQVKTSEKTDTIPSDWTVYEDPLTVRNWVLGNDMVILVRYNLISREARYCVPEEDVIYWDITLDKPVALKCTEPFGREAASELIWCARIRHYDRLARLTQTNHFEDRTWNEVPQYRLFIFEFLVRLGFLDDSEGLVTDEIYISQFLLTLHMASDCEDSVDMTAFEKGRYAACLLLVLVRLRKVSGHEIGLAPFFLDQCACLLVQLILLRTEKELERQLESTESDDMNEPAITGEVF